MFEPPQAWLDIFMGATFKQVIACNLADGAPVPFTTDGDWAARAQVRASYGGVLVMTFASTGTADGTITFDDLGHITLGLTSTATAAMTSTFSSNGRLLTTHVGDLEVWQTSTPTDRRRVTNLKVRIFPEGTTS